MQFLSRFAFLCNILSYISSHKAAKSGINNQNTMLKQKRQAYILHQVNLHNQVLSTGLSLELDVSETPFAATSRNWPTVTNS